MTGDIKKSENELQLELRVSTLENSVKDLERQNMHILNTVSRLQTQVDNLKMLRR